MAPTVLCSLGLQGLRLGVCHYCWRTRSPPLHTSLPSVLALLLLFICACVTPFRAAPRPLDFPSPVFPSLFLSVWDVSVAVDSSAPILTLATFSGLTGPSQGFLYVSRSWTCLSTRPCWSRVSCFAAPLLQICVGAQHSDPQSLRVPCGAAPNSAPRLHLGPAPAWPLRCLLTWYLCWQPDTVTRATGLRLTAFGARVRVTLSRGWAVAAGARGLSPFYVLEFVAPVTWW